MLAELASGRRLLPFRHLYVHIPFCRHKCGYCDFNAYAGMEGLMGRYQAALEVELEQARRRWRFGPLRTVYIGGGTPSLYPPELARRLLRHLAVTFDVEPEAEVTLEANPASTDRARLEAWREGGVNRLSLGVQGFDRRALAVLERRTDGERAVGALALARAAGFDNVNLDLIYGVPFQPTPAWADTVRRALELAPEHLSCYCLSFEPRTLLWRRRQRGLVPEVSEDEQWEQLEIACRLLDKAGYERYEVSNWALPGRQSRHNLAYWECQPVYGAGAGAHSYATDGMRAWRWWNVARPREYIDAALMGVPEVEGEELEPERARAERVMLGLRTAAGLEPPEGFEPRLEALAAAGLVLRRGSCWAPTRRGLDLHNQIALAVL